VTAPAPPQGQQNHDTVEALIERAATRGECLVSALRIPFCVLVLVRFWTCDPPLPARLFNVVLVSLAIAFSAWLLVRVLRRRRIGPHLGLSVLVDVAVCALSLLQTVLWPSDDHSGYTGLLSHPDIAAMLVVVGGAGLRLDARWAALGAIAGLVSIAAVLIVDYSRFGLMWTSQRHEVVLFFILVGAAGALAIVTATRTRALATNAALAAARVQRARYEYVRIVRDQHDARNLISAASLHAELIQRELHGQPSAVQPSGLLFENLREDLQAANALMHAVGERAFSELATLREPETVALAPLLVEAVVPLRTRFPTLSLAVESGEAGPEIPNDSTEVRLVGGRPSLESILVNLVQNAAEGDGRRGARRVWLACRARAGMGVLEVHDDGPGFSAALLAAEGGGSVSTKANGSGLGLHAIAQVVELSGGRLRRLNAPGGGAVVIIELPRVTARAASPVGRAAAAPVWPADVR
jgi:signal transduction histidine kinase